MSVKLFFLAYATKRASAMTSVSESSIQKIRNEVSDNNDFVSPKKKTVRTTVEKANLDSFVLDAIRRIIQNFYIGEKKSPLSQNFF